MEEFISLDLPALLSACFAAVSCAVLGNYLVLRRLSLMGDAISHSVLPGIVIAFLLTSSRAGVTVFVGAAIAGILSAVLIELVRRYGRVETGASMGVIFSIFFAFGVIMIEQAAARSVDLDAECLLHGQLQSIFWYPETSGSALLTWSTIQLLPSEVWMSFSTMLLVLLSVRLFYKEFNISSFDPGLASSLGFSSKGLYQLLMVLVACAVVASFKVVGSILVIAMIICPAATARLFTDRLKVQILLSVFFALSACVLGYLAAVFGPLALGFQHSLSASGMIAVFCGLTLSCSVFLAPQYGLISRALRRARLALTVREDDILAHLYRAIELEQELTESSIVSEFNSPRRTRRAIGSLQSRALLESTAAGCSLTPAGREAARQLVRSHRLWETFLVTEADMPSDHVHHTAEKLEHFKREELEAELVEKQGEIPGKDPHGKEIPDT